MPVKAEIAEIVRFRGATAWPECITRGGVWKDDPVSIGRAAFLREHPSDPHFGVQFQFRGVHHLESDEVWGLMGWGKDFKRRGLLDSILLPERHNLDEFLRPEGATAAIFQESHVAAHLPKGLKRLRFSSSSLTLLNICEFNPETLERIQDFMRERGSCAAVENMDKLERWLPQLRHLLVVS